MTQSFPYNIIFLQITMLLLTTNISAAKTLQSHHIFQEMQCNTSYTNLEYVTSCGHNSIILIKLTGQSRKRMINLHFYCNNGYPVNTSTSVQFGRNIETVTFNSCRFSPNENIIQILIDSLQLHEIRSITFDNELSDNPLSRANLLGIDKVVSELSFNMNNISILPSDLFADSNNLEILSIYSNSGTSSHLSNLLAPLENLVNMELQINNLEDTCGNFLDHQSKLKELELNWNNNKAFPLGFFSPLRAIQRIYVYSNKLEQLPEDLFHDLPHLWNVEIYCKLESIPPRIFAGSKYITDIKINHNNIWELKLETFADQKKLKYLYLSNNKLRTLPDGVFDNNKHLKVLDLSHNQLKSLSNDIFKYLTSLDHLYLENNLLLKLSSDFTQPSQPKSAFDNLINLQKLYLQNNLIKDISFNITILIKNLKHLDLRFNKISYIDCNIVTYIDSIVNITDNPIHCDCKNLCLYQYVTQEPLNRNKRFNSVRCELPSPLKGRAVGDVNQSDMTKCYSDNLQSNISSQCTYQIRPLDSVLVMNCSDQNLTDIPTLPMLEESFSNGIELLMDKNPLTELSSDTLQDNKNISFISIVESSITKLPNSFLSKLPKLKTVSIVLPLEKISDDTFFDSTEIKTLKLSGTNIERLPDLIFVNQTKLIDLDLSKNKLKIISDYDFRTNRNLETLRLSHNLLRNLSSSTFYELHQLKSLYLDNNRLHNVDPDVFLHTPSLKIVNMENNQLATTKYFDSLFGTLDELMLSNNLIGNDFSLGIQRLSPSSIDLSFNNISWIDLSDFGENLSNTFLNFTNNKITTINVTKNTFYKRDLRGIAFGDIPLNCDCNIVSFVQLLRESNQLSNFEDVRCLTPDSLKDRRVSDLSLEAVVCPMNSLCPKKCLCWTRPVDSTLIVNCSNAYLTYIPDFPDPETIFLKGVELSIEHNYLSSLKSNSRAGYNDVTKLLAAHNNIVNISSEDIPPNISFLDLSYNKIERLDENIINVVIESQSLKTVLLHHNPLICDCQSENLTRFIALNKALFRDMDQCGNGDKFHTLSYSAICAIEQSNTETLLGIIVAITLAVLLLLTLFYIKNKEHILVWMYAHQICLCCVTEEEMDKDKKYDAFISYSSQDIEFVANELVSKLESGPRPYKLCLHDRDWLAGGYIPNQIENSVELSKRTIIVMSQNYAKSHWTCLEFRTAHNVCMNEKRARVIVILFGNEVGIIDYLDPDLRTYIKMYTYLRWDDPLFWKKLYCALPNHSKNIKERRKKGNPKSARIDEGHDTTTSFVSNESN